MESASQPPPPPPLNQAARRGPRPLDLPILTHLKKKRVILASASPRRKALLGQVGLTNLEVVPSTFAEDIDKDGITPHEYVALTAQKKCLAVYESLVDESNKKREKAVEEKVEVEENAASTREPDLVIAADTIIATRGGQTLEKPRDEDDHRRMLRHLRDTRSHSVLTAVCCLAPKEDATFPGYSMDVHTEESIVYFAKESDGLPDSVIDSYIRTREGCDKAGGYAVQGIGGLVMIERVEGSVDNVVGLPVRRCLQLAEKVVFRQDEIDDEDASGEE
ncbi:hypothetical protein MKZ38_000077 [Zalerion maritima]|uniref:Maf-like protein n=1 Tax=Zalerion maritima TaxID=339359 RepID=A0AAD5RT88_9PEZI|nr:hypothetical protein MKZ38_000077 [Zalerion maritima]